MTKKYASSAQGPAPRRNGSSTKTAARKTSKDIRQEYDFRSMSGGVRGKYAERVRQSTNIVVLEPDIAKAFPTEDAVNGALRTLLKKRGK